MIDDRGQVIPPQTYENAMAWLKSECQFGAAATLEAVAKERDDALDDHEAMAAERDHLASENVRLSAALELAREERDDKVDGLESDLSSALDVLWRRGDDGARMWIAFNYPKFPTIVKISGWM